MPPRSADGRPRVAPRFGRHPVPQSRQADDLKAHEALALQTVKRVSLGLQRELIRHYYGYAPRFSPALQIIQALAYTREHESFPVRILAARVNG
jgi:hypothetical protein